MNLLDKVIVFGGTHGNEWTGIYAIKHYSHHLTLGLKNLNVEFFHANPEAFKLNKRFKDEDLNRAFQFLNEHRPDSYEHNRAKEIKTLIDKAPCFVIDLHTTTSNMGITIIISHPAPINFKVAAELVKNIPDARIILSPDPQKKYLASQSQFGMMVEVGPVPNSVIHSAALERTLQAIKEALKTLSTLTNLTTSSLEIYEEVEDVYYPQDANGELAAIIHEDFQNKDFSSLNGEYIPFKTFTGMDVMKKTKEELFPIFINEAAYYSNNLAFTLCRKRKLSS